MRKGEKSSKMRFNPALIKDVQPLTRIRFMADVQHLYFMRALVTCNHSFKETYLSLGISRVDAWRYLVRLRKAGVKMPDIRKKSFESGKAETLARRQREKIDLEYDRWLRRPRWYFKNRKEPVEDLGFRRDVIMRLQAQAAALEHVVQLPPMCCTHAQKFDTAFGVSS